ncbi:hypothetical protein FKM82_002967 [Ascaphus truei]
MSAINSTEHARESVTRREKNRKAPAYLNKARAVRKLTGKGLVATEDQNRKELRDNGTKPNIGSTFHQDISTGYTELSKAYLEQPGKKFGRDPIAVGNANLSESETTVYKRQHFSAVAQTTPQLSRSPEDQRVNHTSTSLRAVASQNSSSLHNNKLHSGVTFFLNSTSATLLLKKESKRDFLTASEHPTSRQTPLTDFSEGMEGVLEPEREETSTEGITLTSERERHNDIISRPPLFARTGVDIQGFAWVTHETVTEHSSQVTVKTPELDTLNNLYLTRQSRTDNISSPEPDRVTQPELSIQIQPQLTTQKESKSTTHTKADVTMQIHTQATQPEPNSHEQTHQELQKEQPQTFSQAGLELTSKIDTQVSTQIQTEVNTQAETERQSQTWSELTTESQTQPKPAIQSHQRLFTHTQHTQLQLKSQNKTEINTVAHLTITQHGITAASTETHPEPATQSPINPSTHTQPQTIAHSQQAPTTPMQPELATQTQLELTTLVQLEPTTKTQYKPNKKTDLKLSTPTHNELTTFLPELKKENQTEPKVVTHTHSEPQTQAMPTTLTVQEVTTQTQAEQTKLTQLELTTQTKPELSTQTQSEMATVTGCELTTQTQRELTMHTQPESSTMNHSKPTMQTQPEQTAQTQPEQTAQTQPELTTQTQPELVSQPHPELTTQTHPELTTQIQHELIKQTRPESSTLNHSKPTTKTQPELTTKTQPELTTQTQPEITTQTQRELTKVMQPEASTINHSKPTTQTQPEPTMKTQQEPITQTEPKPTTQTKTELITQAQTEPVTKKQTKQTAPTQPEITTQTDKELATGIQPHPTTYTTEKPNTQTQPGQDTLTQRDQTTPTQQEPATQTQAEISTHNTTSSRVWNGQRGNQSDLVTKESGANLTWSVEATFSPTSKSLPTTGDRSHRGTIKATDSQTVGKLQQGHASELPTTIYPKPQSPSSTLTPLTSSEDTPLQPGGDRIFIVDEQPPVYKVQSINVTYRMHLNVTMPALCEQPGTCQPHVLQEVTSFYKSVPGFNGIEVQNVTLDRAWLEYRVQFSVDVGSVMSETQEILLTDPARFLGSSEPLENNLMSRMSSVSLAEDHADPCTSWFSCPGGFRCLSVRTLRARCLSPCHRTFCHNHGICIHRRGQEPECQCPIGKDFWYMGQTCDYRMTHQCLIAITCSVVICIIICAAAAVFLLVRRFQMQILQQKAAQTQSSYRRFSRYDDVPTHFWCPSQTWLTASASLNSMDNPAFSSSEEVFPLQALGSCVCGCQEAAQNCVQTNPPQPPASVPARLQGNWETSCSSVNDLMIDSGKASDVSVSSWPMEPIHWTPFPILHQLSLQSPFHARRPHSYFEGMELVNTERSWTA